MKHCLCLKHSYTFHGKMHGRQPRWRIPAATASSPRRCRCRRTTGGTAPESTACSFPFVYKGKSYDECTVDDNLGMLWCSTTVEDMTSKFDGSGVWGNCNCAMGLDDATAKYMDSSLDVVRGSSGATAYDDDAYDTEHPALITGPAAAEAPEDGGCTSIRYMRGDCDTTAMTEVAKHDSNNDFSSLAKSPDAVADPTDFNVGHCLLFCFHRLPSPRQCLTLRSSSGPSRGGRSEQRLRRHR